MKKNKEYLPAGKDKRYNVYHDEIDRLMINSQILNGGKEKPSIHTIFWDKQNIQGQLLTIIGNNKGLYKRENTEHIAFIPFVQLKLQELEDKFQKHCKQQTRQGHSRPKEMPPDMLKERLLLEAQLIVYQEEVVELQRRLKLNTDKEQEISYSNVLKSGPAGHSRVEDGVIVELDGMTVKEFREDEDAEPVLIIDCDHPKAKPFDGYSTSDYYRYISTPWLMACQKQAIKNKEQAKKDGVRYENLSRGLRLGTNAPVPSFPDDCINYKKLVLTESKS